MKVATGLATFALTLSLGVGRARAEGSLEQARGLILRGSFEEAASMLEAEVGRRPSSQDAEEAASLALTLRVSLGDWERAKVALERTRAWYGASAPDRYLDGARLMARALLDEANPTRVDEAASLLQRAIAFADKTPFLDRRVALRALSIRALTRKNKLREAKRARAELLALAKREPLAKQALWIQEAKDGKAEALFELGEEALRAVNAVSLAPYQGKGDRDSVMAYYKKHVLPWMPKRYDASAEAERVYARVLDLDLPPEPKRSNPSPSGGDPNAPLHSLGLDALEDGVPGERSPRWAVAAAAQVGAMWASLAYTLRSLPVVPFPKINGISDAEIRAAYDSLVGPSYDDEFFYRAKRSWEACARLASTHRIKNSATDVCFEGLSKRWPYEHRPFEELTPQPVWSR